MDDKLKTKLIDLLEDEAVESIEEIVNRGGHVSKLKMMEVGKIVDSTRMAIGQIMKSEAIPSALPMRKVTENGEF